LGAVVFIVLGILILYFFIGTKNLLLYIVVIVTVSVIYGLKQQDILPYVYGGIILAVLVHLLLRIVLSTELPVVAVVSDSMDHGITDEYKYPCGRVVKDYEKNFDNWWELCGDTYAKFNISKNQFKSFSFKDGFEKGDMPIVTGSDDYKVGDVIVYTVSTQSPPIIHRMVKVNPDGTYQTKGDHNANQNDYEDSIKKDQIQGKVIFIIPKIGYFKVIATELLGRF
jgi:signal peptidase I